MRDIIRNNNNLYKLYTDSMIPIIHRMKGTTSFASKVIRLDFVDL
jgi:hypothetical protein